MKTEQQIFEESEKEQYERKILSIWRFEEGLPDTEN